MHITRIHVQDNNETQEQHTPASLQALVSLGPLSEDEVADHVHDLCCS